MKALLVGESWSQVIIHQKGFDQFQTCVYEEGAKEFERAVIAEGVELDWLRAHDVPAKFPFERDGLSQYDVVVLSDIGSNSFLLSPQVMSRSERTTNRLELLADWTEQGGGLVMVGGYLSFSGIEARARFGESPLARVLPVEISSHDDRVERPEGVTPKVLDAGHAVLSQVEESWPDVLGYNRVVARSEAKSLAVFDDDPALVVAKYGQGRSVAFTSDLAPHWAPPEFVRWKHYGRLWANVLRWAAGHQG